MEKSKDSPGISQPFLTYFNRYAHPIEYLQKIDVPNELKTVVAIPCFDEPRLIDTLESLYHCHSTSYPIEIIVLINQMAMADTETEKRNTITFELAKQWADTHSDNKKQFHILYVKDIPQHHAGVGQARKLVMDEAVRRLVRSDEGDGGIACLDADCTCDPDYLREIEKYFYLNPQTTGATLYFEHPIEEIHDRRHRLGIASYELHLRYLIHALRYSGFPYAFHAMGSCMAVRASTYAKQGGMNRRKAGEDFHFLQKIIPLGNFSEISSTRVIPSSRISRRVPFGTGKAMMNWQNSIKDNFCTYHPTAFAELKILFNGIDAAFNAPAPVLKDHFQSFPPRIRDYLGLENWQSEILRIRNQSRTITSFRDRFYRYMNGLKVLQYLHFARDRGLDNVPVLEACKWLNGKKQFASQEINDVFHGLSALRKYDRENSFTYLKPT